jgi:hypothetical protein
MARVPFSSLFRTSEDGSLTANQPIRVGGITLPQGFIFRSGMVFGGIDLTQYADHELEVVTDSGVMVITGIY